MWNGILLKNCQVYIIYIKIKKIQRTYSKECLQKTFPGLNFVTVHVSKWKLRKDFLWSFHIYIWQTKTTNQNTVLENFATERTNLLCSLLIILRNSGFSSKRV